MIRVFYYTALEGANPVGDFLAGLELDHRRRIQWHLNLLAQYGLDLRRPHSDTVRGPLKELRVRVGKLRYRVLYFFLTQDAAILVHAFVKEQDRLEEKDIDRAGRRLKDFRDRYSLGKIKL
jgi:phage-related protein